MLILKAQLCRTNARVGDVASSSKLTMLICLGLAQSTFEALPPYRIFREGNLKEERGTFSDSSFYAYVEQVILTFRKELAALLKQLDNIVAILLRNVKYL